MLRIVKKKDTVNALAVSQHNCSVEKLCSPQQFGTVWGGFKLVTLCQIYLTQSTMELLSPFIEEMLLHPHRGSQEDVLGGV